MLRNRERVLALLSAGLLATSVPAWADWTASGTALYRDREFGSSGFTGVEPLLPVRFADVEILDAVAETVLASGSTDALGAFSILVPDNQVRDVQVRIVARADETPDLHLEVTANNLTPYAIAGPVVGAHASDADLNFGGLAAEIGQGGEAFNCWDNGILGSDFLAYLQGSRPGPSDSLRIVWQIDRGATASFATSSRIDIRDTSGYDDTVILHEYGHYAVLNFSASSNPGGSHSFSQCNQNPALAWDEGHATFFGSAVRKHFGLALPNIYLRTTGAPGPGGVALYADLETETEFECSGSTSEVSVFTALWDIVDGPGEQDFTPGIDDTPEDNLNLDATEHWEVMTDSLPGRFSITAEDYWDAWFETPVSNGHFFEMISIFGGVEIEYFEDAFETNDSRATAAPIQVDGVPIDLTFFSDPDGDGSGDEIREDDWFSFQAFQGLNYRIETLNLWSGADTKINIRDNSGPPLASNDDRAPGDPSSFVNWIPPSDDTYYVEVIQPNDLTHYGSYDLLIVPPINDADGDGVLDAVDNCVADFNPGQTDFDQDNEGDICDLNDGLIYITFQQPDIVEWQEEGFSTWNSYKGDLEVLKTTGIYTQDRTCGLNVPFVADTDPLLPGQVAFFLTTGVDGGNETSLGVNSQGTPRPNDNPCP